MTDDLSRLDTLPLFEPGSLEHPGQMRLTRIQVCNWGTLDGYHDVAVPRKGFLVTGGSGSGKSTLIDAISAVLVPPAHLRFNAAAQDEAGRGSGRSVVSYIRGAWRRGTDEESGDLASVYLRPKATFSAIGLTYSDGDNHCVTLLLLLYLRSGENSASGVKRLHGLAEHSPADMLELPDFFGYLRSGIDTRALKREMPEVKFNESYSAFSAAFRRRLGIASESAQLLLHRTLSAKSLSSLDQLFREFMLDKPATFDVADRAVDQFAELSEAHRSVVDIRQQIHHLAPLAALGDARSELLTRTAQLEAESETFPAVQSAITTELVEEELRTARGARVAHNSTVVSARNRLESVGATAEDLRIQLRGAAGTSRDELAREAERARSSARTVTEKSTQVAAAVQLLGGELPTSAESFAVELAKLDREDEAQNKERAQASVIRLELGGDIKLETASLDQVRLQLESLLRHQSNIAPHLLAARERICREAGLKSRELPFAGELLDVSPDHIQWRPAIERVLSPFARTMLVPEALRSKVSAAVDSLHLGVRLVYEVIDLSDPAAARRTGPHSLVRKVTATPGPFQAWLHRRLATQFDYVCVNTSTELDQHDRAVTINGLIKRGKRFEKDDRRKINDSTQFQLGSPDDATIEALTSTRQEIEARIAHHQKRWAALDTADTERRARQVAATTLRSLQWDEIDVASANHRADAAQKKLEKWRDAHPEVAEMERDLHLTEEHLRQAKEKYETAAGELAIAANEVRRLEDKLVELEAHHSAVVDEAAASRIRERFTSATRRLTVNNVQSICQQVVQAIAKEQVTTSSELGRTHNKITAILTSYREGWPARKSDLGTGPEFVGEAVEWLLQLRRDRLAEFEDRFLTLIGDMQKRNLGLLWRHIRGARSRIESGIAPVNDSLRRSEFQSDRWLQIEVRDRRSEMVTEFLNDLEKAVSGSLDQRSIDTAEAGFAVMARLLDKLGSSDSADRSWRSAVLDTRRHVGFIGVEIDADGTATNYHDSSSGLSGGQAQKLVFFCLAAALRFQLADIDADVPKYGTVVLDEAFDRADPEYTRRAMDVFTDFGFHMVLATPLKLLQTLEQYIGGLVVVTNADGSTSRIEHVTWESN